MGIKAIAAVSWPARSRSWHTHHAVDRELTIAHSREQCWVAAGADYCLHVRPALAPAIASPPRAAARIADRPVDDRSVRGRMDEDAVVRVVVTRCMRPWQTTRPVSSRRTPAFEIASARRGNSDCCSHAPPAARDVCAAPLARGHPREGGQALDRSAAADALPLEAALRQLDTDFELHRLSHRAGDAAGLAPDDETSARRP